MYNYNVNTTVMAMVNVLTKVNAIVIKVIQVHFVNIIITVLIIALISIRGHVSIIIGVKARIGILAMHVRHPIMTLRAIRQYVLMIVQIMVSNIIIYLIIIIIILLINQSISNATIVLNLIINKNYTYYALSISGVHTSTNSNKVLCNYYLLNV